MALNKVYALLSRSGVIIALGLGLGFWLKLAFLKNLCDNNEPQKLA